MDIKVGARGKDPDGDHFVVTDIEGDLAYLVFPGINYEDWYNLSEIADYEQDGWRFVGHTDDGGQVYGLTISATPELRVVDPDTGGEKGAKALELGFIDPLALEELGKVASFGGRKYASFNYLKGYAWSLSFNAAFRHMLKFLKGEDRDYSTCKEHPVWSNHDWSCTDCGSGLLHTTHLAWHGLALTSFILRKIGTDDRAKS